MATRRSAILERRRSGINFGGAATGRIICAGSPTISRHCMWSISRCFGGGVSVISCAWFMINCLEIRHPYRILTKIYLTMPNRKFPSSRYRRTGSGASRGAPIRRRRLPKPSTYATTQLPKKTSSRWRSASSTGRSSRSPGSSSTRRSRPPNCWGGG